MRRIKILTQTFFLLFIALTAVAQTGIVKGKVVTSDKKPASLVNIELKDLKKFAISKEDGSYEFTKVKAGNYTVVITYTGLVTQYKKLSLAEGETKVIDITLAENAAELDEVIVTATKSQNEKIASVGKIPVAAKDIPQSIQIIGKDVLERQQVLRLSDALQNVPGVYVMGTTGGYQEEIAARGYAFGSSNTFKNGARFNNGTMPEMSGVEKVEFLKGGSAILFGNVAAGGVMNIVTKKPKFETGGEISFRTGSFDFYKPSLDVYGAFNNSTKAAYRFNTTYEKAGGFRNEVKSERFYINPSFLFKLGSKTELLVEGDYMKDNRTPDFGIGAIDYQIPNLPRERFLGVNWQYNKAEQTSGTATITHHLNSNWQVRGQASYQVYDNELFAAARPSSTNIKADGTLSRSLQKSSSNENYYVAQVDVTGKFATGKISHVLLFGADADKYNTVTTSYNAGKPYDTVNIFNPATFNIRRDIPYLTENASNKSPISRFGVYAQDLVSIADKLKLLAGLRYTYQKNHTTSANVAGYDNKALSPRLGLVYQPKNNISLFASYTNSFTVNTGFTIVSAQNATGLDTIAIKPSIIDQFEVGLKTDLFKGLVSTNITLYQIINNNFTQTQLTLPNGVANTNTTYKELAGQTVSKGIEVDIETKSIHGFTLIAGYSYNDTRYTKSNLYKTDDRLRYNPAHTGNASLYYTFNPKTALKGFNLGFSAYYVGDRVAGRNQTTTNPGFKLIALPNYTLFDLAAGYALHNYSVRLKFSNLFNQLSYNVHDDNSVNPIAPTQFAATFAYRF